MTTYNFIAGVTLVIELAIIAVVAWALIVAATRPSRDFALAQQKKGFWVGILTAALLVSGDGLFYFIPLPFNWLLSMASIFAAIYFLGPECQRMGPRRRRGGGRDTARGGW